MIVTYTPAGSPPQTFPFRPFDMGPEEYEPIEALGLWESLEEFDRAVRHSQRTAWRVALWTCMRRETPDLTLDQVRPRALEVAVRYEPDEELAIAELTLADPDTAPALRAVLEANLPDGPWAIGDAFTLADCAAAPSLFYADWIEEIGPKRPRLAAYRARLLAHPIVSRAVDEGRPYRAFFPLGAPDRD